MEENHELKIEQPCHMRWAELKGAGSRRYCDQCALHVVDGSAMTKVAAEKLVRESEERVCMRVELNPQGEVVHVPEPSLGQRVLSGIGWTLASGLLVACVDGDAKETPMDPAVDPGTETGTTEPPVERPREIMGDVCYPMDSPDDDQAHAEDTSERDDEAESVLLDPREALGRMKRSPVEPD